MDGCMDASLLHQSHEGGLSCKSEQQLDTHHTMTMPWLSPKTISEWITLPSHIYKVFKHLPMQWMVIWMHPYFIKAMGMGWDCWIWFRTGYKTYYYDMAEARILFRLDNTSTLYIYKVFQHLLMQWIAMSMHPYSIKAMGVCWDC